MSIRNYSNTAAQSTLTGSIGATDTSIALANYAGDPTPPFTAALARGTATEEIILVTGVTGSTVTVTRGYDGTSAQAQAAGATFQEVVVALDFREANNHVNATGAVHGVAGGLVGTTDAQTLTNKTLTSPTSTNPTDTGTSTIATAVVTTLTVSGVSTLTTLNVSGTATVAVLRVTGTPTVAADAARKDYVDSSIANTGTALSTVSTLVRRDAAGAAEFSKVTLDNAPASASDAVRKDYVDARAALPDTTWTVPAYLNGWVDYGQPNFTGARFRKLATGQVEVQGMVKGGAIGGGVAVFQLPTGYRPGATLPFATLGNNAAARVDVQNDGKVCVVIGSTAAWTSLNLTFFAEA